MNSTMTMTGIASDKETADAFAQSWNHLPPGSIYTREQFEDWLSPLTRADAEGHRVLELGCGNGSLMVHMASWHPAYLEGVDLGDSVLSARKNLSALPFPNWRVIQGDLTEFASDGFDLVYCIGVIHHLKDPKKGFDSVVRNTSKGGRFHIWVYAREGNRLVLLLVEPLRRIASKLPWWFTKYCVATPLAVPFFVYAKCLAAFRGIRLLTRFPLYEYALWIAPRNFGFFRHVAFDQLVTPQTTYPPKSTIEAWLRGTPSIDPASTYLIMRNGNSWKFGAAVRTN